jgi:predicted acylesterase/phospholipase RssA
MGNPSATGGAALAGETIGPADQDFETLLAKTPLPLVDLEARFTALERASGVGDQWWHARRVQLKLRAEGRTLRDADVRRWKERRERAARLVGAEVAQQPPDRIDLARLGPLLADLKGLFDFGMARTLIERVRDVLPEGRKEWFWQQLALCTYKDEELVPNQRFRPALRILDEIPKIAPTTRDGDSAETLALRGAIYKRMWEFGGQTDYLYEAVKHYLSAWSRDRASDKGYGGVNAAYLMDVLAGLEQPITAAAQVDGHRIGENWSTRARALREEMKRELPRLVNEADAAEYWYRATMAEIHWGLGEWADAGEWLERASANDISEWELQTTVKQLVAIARVQGVPTLPSDRPPAEWPAAWQALRRLTGEDTPSVATYHRGKVGLALSGGGFRASLYHLGVLARLAEMDVLRSVEVLSTVSGGSIVGAHYYLALRALLQTRSDRELTREDYVELVKTVQAQFLTAISHNLRTRGLTNLFYNLRFIFGGSYTRSNRMGELYEDYIYSRVADGHPRKKPRLMRDLLIRPRVHDRAGQASYDAAFNPKFSNWRRRAKVPILLLNATSLNTGHSWHFTARSMGEPPGLLGPEADTIPRYRRLWYDEAPSEKLRSYRLGWAVAASACVPALFEPLELKGLYRERTVRLVDGGVHDNQGVAGLLDESCTLVLCSDASGQMGDRTMPSNSLLGVPLRANSILMGRVRESQYVDVASRTDSHALQGLFFVHLRQELTQDPITWIDGTAKVYPRRPAVTSYGVDRELQASIAGIRTDLDSFSEVEAHALMASGYLMTKREFERLDAEHRAKGGPGTWGDFDVGAPSRGPGAWPFLALAPILATPSSSHDRARADLGRQLAVGSSLFLRAFKLSRTLSAVGIGALVLIVVGLGYLVYENWGEKVAFSGTVGGILLSVLLLVAGMVWGGVRFLNPEGVMRSWLVKAGVALGGFGLANFVVYVIDPIFKRRGKAARLLRLSGR